MTGSDLRYDLFEDALGFAVAVARGGRLVGLGHYPSRGLAEQYKDRHWPEASLDLEAVPIPEVRRQLAEYLAGQRRAFDVPLELGGTEFQRLCWEELLRIPFGETRTYGEQARRIGRPDRARAVGAANGANPIAIILPCHRVIGADGSLVGFGGGLETKRRLLDLESGILTLV
jgi:O-6-methylguanine DNA methyltransferase